MHCTDVGQTPIITWLDDANKQEHSQKKYTKKKGASVIYSCFEASSEFYKSIDPFWSDLLFSCSKGTFPRGFSYKFFPGNPDIHIISTGRGAKKVDYTLPSEPSQMARFCVDMFRSFSIYSPKDIEERLKLEKKMTDSVAPVDDWSKVRSKPTRYKLIKEYVFTQFANYSPEHRTRIYMVICSCLDQKKITKKNIRISGGRITDISGFHITEDSCFCLIDKCQAGTKVKEQGREPIHQYYKNWVTEREKLYGVSHKSAATTTGSTPFA